MRGNPTFQFVALWGAVVVFRAPLSARKGRRFNSVSETQLKRPRLVNQCGAFLYAGAGTLLVRQTGSGR